MASIVLLQDDPPPRRRRPPGRRRPRRGRHAGLAGAGPGRPRGPLRRPGRPAGAGPRPVPGGRPALLRGDGRLGEPVRAAPGRVRPGGGRSPPCPAPPSRGSPPATAPGWSRASPPRAARWRWTGTTPSPPSRASGWSSMCCTPSGSCAAPRWTGSSAPSSSTGCPWCPLHRRLAVPLGALTEAYPWLTDRSMVYGVEYGPLSDPLAAEGVSAGQPLRRAGAAPARVGRPRRGTAGWCCSCRTGTPRRRRRGSRRPPCGCWCGARGGRSSTGRTGCPGTSGRTTTC